MLVHRDYLYIPNHLLYAIACNTIKREGMEPIVLRTIKVQLNWNCNFKVKDYPKLWNKDDLFWGSPTFLQIRPTQLQTEGNLRSKRVPKGYKTGERVYTLSRSAIWSTATKGTLPPRSEVRISGNSSKPSHLNMMKTSNWMSTRGGYSSMIWVGDLPLRLER